MKKKALITGIAGQDGSYLTEHLLSLGYEVHGIVRRHSVAENQNHRLHKYGLGENVHAYYGDLLDYPSLVRIVSQVMPDEIYNLGAMSHVRVSFDMPSFTIQTNAVGVLHLLEVYRTICPSAKFYQASSSEMFGNSVDDDGFQRLTTPMNPVSPYGCSRRGSNFVTNKVVKGAVAIKKGLQENLELGNMDSYRDWGHSQDYVRAMHMIVNHDVADEFIVATGEAHSVRDLCDTVFTKLGMDYRDYVVQNPKYMRPEELKYLKGDSTKSREVLGWVPEFTFETLLDDMIERWQNEL